MSCLHVSGLAALLQSAHPECRRALGIDDHGSTAYVGNTPAAGRLLDAATGDDHVVQLRRGTGHIDPARPLDPGLVYELAGHPRLRGLSDRAHSSTAQP